MSIIGDGITLSNGGEKANIFITGLKDTDTVRAIKQSPSVVKNPMDRLPDGYTELTYIESTGSQYIDLDKPVVNGQTIFECDIEYTGFYNDDFDWFIGSRINNTHWLAGYYNGKPCYWQGYTYAGTLSAGERTKLVINFVNHYFTNTAKESYTSIDSSYALSTPARIFIGNGNSFSKSTKCKCYSVLQHNNNQTVLNLVPCRRESDGHIGMFDIVNKVFYQNKGSSPFLAGKDIPKYIDGYTDGSKTIIGKLTQIVNPKRRVPIGYTELEYIEGNCNQAINTGIMASSGYRVEAEIMFGNRGAGSDENVIVPYTYAGDQRLNFASRYKGNFVLGYGGWNSAGKANINTKYKIDSTIRVGNQVLIVDGSQKYSGSSTSSFSSDTIPFYLFALNGSPRGTGRLYYCKFYDVNETLVKDFIPCKRNSDGAIGVYDAVNGNFHENMYDTPFVAGPSVDIAEYINAFVIPLNLYGMWRVEVKYDSEVDSKYVLVDCAVEQLITMGHKLWLYKDGNECTNITGGWSNSGYTYGGSANIAAMKNYDNIYATVHAGGNIVTGIVNPVDVTNYNTLFVEIMKTDPYNLHQPWIVISSDKSFNNRVFMPLPSSANVKEVLCLGISDFYGNRYVSFGHSNGVCNGSGFLYKVWLE